MANFGAGDVDTGKIEIERKPPLTTVTYSPTDETRKRYPRDTKGKSVKILEFNSDLERISIFPILTLLGTGRFTDPKYQKIKIISLPINSDDIPDTIDGVEDFLSGLPRGFIKDWQFGLGLVRDYKYMIDAIEALTECEEIRLGYDDAVGISNNILFIPLRDFEAGRTSLDRIHGRGQTATSNVKRADAHNWAAILTGQQVIEYKRGRHPMIQALADAAAANEQFTDEELDELITVLQSQSRTLSGERPGALAKLRSDIELVELDVLIARFEEMMAVGHGESKWQGFLTENPFLLSYASGHPVVLVQGQASVGGQKLSGKGEKIVDFLTRNPTTNNVALFEIKTPSAPLVQTKAYRDGVFRPSKDLSGSIVQALDQRYQLQTTFANKKMTSRIYDIEAFSVRICVIIGRAPTDPDFAKSFELFRHGFKDVEIVTFDELLERVKMLRSLLRQQPIPVI